MPNVEIITKDNKFFVRLRSFMASSRYLSGGKRDGIYFISREFMEPFPFNSEEEAREAFKAFQDRQKKYDNAKNEAYKESLRWKNAVVVSKIKITWREAFWM